MRNIVADIRGLIHDAWEFYAPATVRLSIVIGIWMLLDEGRYLESFLRDAGDAFKRLGESSIVLILDRFNLTALMPLLALFIVSLVFTGLTELFSL